MATVTICDRCGELVEPHPNEATVSSYEFYRHGHLTDLCNECATDLTNWWREKNKG